MGDAFEAARDASKQVLTLTAAILTITITFAKDLAGDASVGDQRWLEAAWLAFALSIVAGCWTLLAIVGTMGSPTPPPHEDDASVYAPQVRWAAAAQMVAFGLGMALTVVFGILAVGDARLTSP